MELKIAFLTKLFVTNVALKILDVFMNDFYMFLKSTLLSKIFVTSIAFEFLNLLMNTFDMKLQTGKTFELFLTDSTDVELHFRIVSVDSNSI